MNQKNLKILQWWQKTSVFRLYVVAFLVMLHVIAILLKAIPVPGYSALVRSAWKDVTVQRELTAWNERIAHLGINLSNEEFEEILWQLTVKVMDIHERVLAPFNWYYNYFGTYQSWQMFVAPQTHPSKWSVRIYEDHNWRTIFEERSSRYVWRIKQLSHPMMRYVIFFFSWQHSSRSDYADFGDWIFRQIKHDFPRATMAEIAYFGFDTKNPAAVRAGEPIAGEWHSVLRKEF